ncbi:hypothetical protein ACHAPO_011644 [Fusarium lateritium]
MSPAQASSVPLAGNTAWLALFSKDCLAVNRDASSNKASILIWGGNTTVGYYAIQLAKLYNIEVATTCSPRNFDKARRAGATHVFDYNDNEAIAKIKAALPDLRHVFDTVGNETSSATAAKAIGHPEGVLCTVRPGKANTQDVPSHIKVTDVFVFTAFPTEHNYRGKAHWPSYNKPAWKVIVIEHLTDDLSTGLGTFPRLEIAFFAHHAIADGLSGIAFHSSLIDNLQLSLDLVIPARWPLKLDETLSIPPTVEECMDISPCKCIPCNSQSNPSQPVWAGDDISPTPETDFESRVRIITFLPEVVCRILRKCKLAKVTLTGLLHAYICTALQRALKKEGIDEGSTLGFRSVTPFQIRQHTRVSDKDILNHISYLTTYVHHGELDKTVACDAYSDSEEKHIVELARFFSDDIVTKVKQFPHGNNMARQLAQIPDKFQYCKSQGGQKRQYTYELSNLGLILSISPPEGSGIKLEKLVFTQCGFVAGPALGFNCVSVKGGPLTLSVTWQGGIVQESIIESVIDELEARMSCHQEY